MDQRIKYTRTLTIAGSDSGGGAGIQADIKTFSALKCYGMSVLTALTAQNTEAVTAIHPISANFVAQQIDAVAGDIGVDAVKIGMVYSANIIAAIVDCLRFHHIDTVVVDPVMVAKSGDILLDSSAINALRSELLPLATIITPNASEAAVLLDADDILSVDDLEQAALKLASMTATAVLVKGGHVAGNESVDVFAIDGTTTRFASSRIDTPNTHGTGCTLSSAICAYLAHGYSIPQSVEYAKHYITEAITAGAQFRLGAGHGPVHHFYNVWKQT